MFPDLCSVEMNVGSVGLGKEKLAQSNLILGLNCTSPSAAPVRKKKCLNAISKTSRIVTLLFFVSFVYFFSIEGEKA